MSLKSEIIKIVHSSDPDIRYKASSGGFLSNLVRWLFQKKMIKCALSFRKTGIRFEPIMVKSWEEYEIVGSIYQEMNLADFITREVSVAVGAETIFLTCLPCEVAVLRKILTKKGYSCIIAGLTCSGQMTIEATTYLMKQLDIKPEDVTDFRYRGNGWPSGVQISTNSKKYFVDNHNSIWNDIVHSEIFKTPKCNQCTLVFPKAVDFAVADPWYRDIVATDKTGMTVVWAQSEIGQKMLLEMQMDHVIEIFREIDLETLMESQKQTSDKKQVFKRKKALMKVIRVCIQSKIYKTFVFPRFHNKHKILLKKLVRLCKKF